MSSFLERQKSLFDQLKDAEEQYSFSKSNKATNALGYGIIDKHSHRKLKHEMKQFRGRESIFKREEANIRECLRAKTIPDYIKNPKKWVYYSLSDVTPEQMSDTTNTATAQAFIREMENRETNQTDMICETDETGVFKKPMFLASKTVKKVPEAEEIKPVFKSNKIIMPEYVVGVTRKKEKRNKKNVLKETEDSSATTKKAELKLKHLYDEDDE